MYTKSGQRTKEVSYHFWNTGYMQLEFGDMTWVCTTTIKHGYELLDFVTPHIFDHLICLSRKYVNVFLSSYMDEII
jgi:hypothetical protein